MEAKRARRRRDKQRMKAKAIRIFSLRSAPNPANVKLADHLAHCSGWCCANPRKWDGAPTIQERRFLAVSADES